jgi:regulator of protease activity HflC (stomatin/prohibitin superfamily)
LPVKRIFFGIGFFVFFIIWLFCFKMISPGYVGVVVDLFGDNKGVESKELHVGMHWIAPWKSVYTFPIFEQNDTWEGKNEFHFQTSEGLACTAEIGITYHLKAEYIPKIFGKYRRGMDEITEIFMHNFIRDAINKCASKMKIEDLYGPGKESFLTDVQEHVATDLKPIGIEVSRIYLIGRFHFPQNVIAALNSKIEAIQRAQQRENELRESEAEAKKLIAKSEGWAKCRLIEAEAQAQANDTIAKSLTSEILGKMAIEKWDGQLPMYIGGGQIMTQIPVPPIRKQSVPL